MAANPDSAAGHSGLGIALDLQGRHGEAQAEYRKSLALADSDATRANLGLSLAMSGDATGAVEMLRPLASDPAASAKVRHNLAFALELAGDRRGAERALGPDLPRNEVAEALSGFDAFRVAAVPVGPTPLAAGTPIVLNPPAAVAAAAPAAPPAQRIVLATPAPLAADAPIVLNPPPATSSVAPAGQAIVLATPLQASALDAAADQPIVLRPPVPAAEARAAKPDRSAGKAAPRPTAPHAPVVQVAATPITVPAPAAPPLVAASTPEAAAADGQGVPELRAGAAVTAKAAQ